MDGISPERFADLALARTLESTEAAGSATMVRTRAALAPDCGARVLEISGVWAMFDGVDSPLTQTFGMGVFEPIEDEDLDRIEDFFNRRGAQAQHEICPHAGVELTARLVARGYRPIEMSNVLYRGLAVGLELAGSRNDGIQVRQVTDEDREVWARTAAAGWSAFGDLSTLMGQVAAIDAHRHDSALFLASLAGEPIAAAGLILGREAAFLSGASTIPAARRQGAQLALLEHRLQVAASRGLTTAMMVTETGSTSQRNAERHGFRVAYTRTKWRQSASLPGT